MGAGPKWIEASSGGKNNGFGSCETHHVSSSPQEDRGGAAEEVGEGEGGEEGGVAVIVASPALFNVQCRTPRQIDLANSLAWNEVILSG
jgi:hypothetical protein